MSNVDTPAFRRRWSRYSTRSSRKDVSNLPLSNEVRSTQNGVAIRLDDGLWQTVDSVGKYRLFAIDQVEAVLEAVPYKMRNEIWRDGDRLP